MMHRLRLVFCLIILVLLSGCGLNNNVEKGMQSYWISVDNISKDLRNSSDLVEEELKFSYYDKNKLYYSNIDNVFEDVFLVFFFDDGEKEKEASGWHNFFESYNRLENKLVVYNVYLDDEVDKGLEDIKDKGTRLVLYERDEEGNLIHIRKWINPKDITEVPVKITDAEK